MHTAKARLSGRLRTCRRWAIFTDSHGLLGVGRFLHSSACASYPYLLPTMLFRTRREAREALPAVKGPADLGRFPDAQVVRVLITVEVE